ncbi:hypothetical protein J7K99_05590 [bacterium]|nr:hypothetical protein [bacterium]
MKGRRLVLFAIVSFGFAIPAQMTYQGKITDPSCGGNEGDYSFGGDGYPGAAGGDGASGAVFIEW